MYAIRIDVTIDRPPLGVTTCPIPIPDVSVAARCPQSARSLIGLRTMPPLHFSTLCDQKLIKLVRENPLLYNPEHPAYSSSDSKELTWQKISDALGRPTQRCKSRWLNIRDQLRRNLRLRLEHPEEKQGRKYRYEDDLQFLVPHFKLKSGEDLSEFIDDTEQFEEIQLPTPSYTKCKDDMFTNASYRSQEDFGLQLATASYQEGTANETEEAVYQDLNPSDPLDVFLMAIGSSLRKLKPFYLNQAKSKIFQICQDYELQQITDKPG